MYLLSQEAESYSTACQKIFLDLPIYDGGEQ